MEVSVIIVNYNTKLVTKQCIDSIASLTHHIKYEIILVDNASTDGSTELFENDSRITLIKSNKNLGFGKANNLGYAYSQGKYIFLLNSDTILLNNAIKLFYDKMEMFPKTIACIGTKLLSADGVSEGNSYNRFPSISSIRNSILNIFFSSLINRNRNNQQMNIGKIFEVDFVTGADLFIRREVIEKCGLFDSDFFMYFEDSEMQYRYYKAGYKAMIISEPQIIHLESGSTDGSSTIKSYNKSRIYFQGMLLYMRKRYTGFKYLISRLLILGFIPILLNKKYRLHEIWSMIYLLISPIKIIKQ